MGGCVLKWLNRFTTRHAHVVCATAGTTRLLQLIEGIQQSRAFHETCKSKLPDGQAAKIPEVGSSYDCRTAVLSRMHMHMCIQFMGAIKNCSQRARYLTHHVLSTQAGGFLPKLLEDAGLLRTSTKTAEGRKKSNEEMLKLNVILVYKKLVQGLIYSPPDCDKYLALDATPQV